MFLDHQSIRGKCSLKIDIHIAFDVWSVFSCAPITTILAMCGLNKVIKSEDWWVKKTTKTTEDY